MEQKTPVVIIYGGVSSEHEISCRSAAFLVRNIDTKKFSPCVIAIDKLGTWYAQDFERLSNEDHETLPIHTEHLLYSNTEPSMGPGCFLRNHVEIQFSKKYRSSEICIFPITHGTNGEDGRLQGYLEFSGFSFVGPDVLGSSVAMDKHVAKLLVAEAGIPVVPFRVIRQEAWRSGRQKFIDEVIDSLGHRLFVKPVSLGSSVGISKVTSGNELSAAVELAFEFDEKIMIEKSLEVREIECAALGGYKPKISGAGEVNSKSNFYSYKAKYEDPQGAEIKVPADLSTNDQIQVKSFAKAAFQALNLYGLARLDFFLESSSGKLYFNEANTLPGMTAISQYPLLWQASGVLPTELISRLVGTALKRSEERNRLKRSI